MSPRGTDTPAPDSQRRRLVVRFATLEEFAAEYRRNIGNGGIFVATAEEFELREVVAVMLDLVFSDAVVQLDGEVVRCVRPELAGAGGTPGVAVQLLEPAEEVRRRLGALASLPATQTFEPTTARPLNTRSDERFRTRIAARVAGEHGRSRSARTANLSTSDALVPLGGEPLPTGTAVRITLVHPTTADELRLRGIVVRHEPGAGGSTGHGIRFDPPEDGGEAVREFVESVRRADDARRLTAITGPIQSVGLPNLLQMFSSSTERGTLLVARGADEGLIAFESGSLRFARLGRARGVKALARLFAWPEASFEFHARAYDSADEPGDPIPMYGAVMEALQQVDERNRIDPARLPETARVRAAAALPAAQDEVPAKLESAILDLLGAQDRTVGAILDALPDPDAEILNALLALVDAGVLAIRPA